MLLVYCFKIHSLPDEVNNSYEYEEVEVEMSFAKRQTIVINNQQNVLSYAEYNFSFSFFLSICLSVCLSSMFVSMLQLCVYDGINSSRRSFLLRIICVHQQNNVENVYDDDDASSMLDRHQLQYFLLLCFVVVVIIVVVFPLILF